MGGHQPKRLVNLMDVYETFDFLVWPLNEGDHPKE